MKLLLENWRKYLAESNKKIGTLNSDYPGYVELYSPYSENKEQAQVGAPGDHAEILGSWSDKGMTWLEVDINGTKGWINSTELILDKVEDWRAQTTWTAKDDEKITLGDVVDYLGDETIDINVLELSQQLPPLPTRSAERVAAASLDYPIIVVKSEGQYRFVLDGNHRLQQAIERPEVKTIKAKILDLDNPEIPEVFQRVFGGTE